MHRPQPLFLGAEGNRTRIRISGNSRPLRKVSQEHRLDITKKGTSQDQRPVSPQRTGYEEGRRIREMRALDMTL
jgi:hypothetical protein